MKTLRDVVPPEFQYEYMETPAMKLLDVEVVQEMDSFITRWPGHHKNIHVWWRLANGKCVGWNENPGRGWSFPIYKEKSK